MALGVKDGETTITVGKCWKKTEKYLKCSFNTTGTKNAKTGEWKNDFDGYATFIGKALPKISILEEGQTDKFKIKTSNFKLSSYLSSKNNVVIDMVIFDFDFVEVPQTLGKQASSDGFMNIPDGIDTEMPFN